MAHTQNPNNQEANVGGSLWVQARLCYKDPISKNKNKNQKEPRKQKEKVLSSVILPPPHFFYPKHISISSPTLWWWDPNITFQEHLQSFTFIITHLSDLKKNLYFLPPLRIRLCLLDTGLLISLRIPSITFLVSCASNLPITKSFWPTSCCLKPKMLDSMILRESAPNKLKQCHWCHKRDWRYSLRCIKAPLSET